MISEALFQNLRSTETRAKCLTAVIFGSSAFPSPRRLLLFRRHYAASAHYPCRGPRLLGACPGKRAFRTVCRTRQSPRTTHLWGTGAGDVYDRLLPNGFAGMGIYAVRLLNSLRLRLQAGPTTKRDRQQLASRESCIGKEKTCCRFTREADGYARCGFSGAKHAPCHF